MLHLKCADYSLADKSPFRYPGSACLLIEEMAFIKEVIFTASPPPFYLGCPKKILLWQFWPEEDEFSVKKEREVTAYSFREVLNIDLPRKPEYTWPLKNRFELGRSTYSHIFFNKYIAQFFRDLHNLKKPKVELCSLEILKNLRKS